jgi:hypothetical protein
MHINQITNHVFRPTRGGAAGVVWVFAAGLALALKAGLFGIALGGLLVSWYAKYCFFLFDSVVRGVDEPPVLDIQHLNPFGERRPLVLVGIVAVLGGAVTGVYDLVGRPAGVGLAVLAAMALPASVAMLGLEENILFALSPHHVARLIHGLGARYLLVLGIIVGYAALGYEWVLWMPWLILKLVGPLFAILSLFSALAGMLYVRRDQLGIEVWHSPEREAEHRAREQRREDDRMLDAAFTQARLGARAAATKILSDWLQSRGNRPEDYRWLCDRLESWPDAGYLRGVTADYVERLLRLQRPGEALDVVAARLRTLPDFRPGSAIATLQVAQLAARGGAPGVARALLADFAARFPGDACVPRAAELARAVDRGSRVD